MGEKQHGDRFEGAVTEFPREIVEFAGCGHLHAGWLPPVGAGLAAGRCRNDPVPAILEHLPYRKRDGTIVRDALTHPYFAGHGYACDPRRHARQWRFRRADGGRIFRAGAATTPARSSPGSPSSPGATGKVGMMGISWGGFNCLQVAAQAAAGAEGGHHPLLDRRPLCRRHPLQGRLPAEREFRLGVDHAVLFVAAAGPAARRRQRWRDLWLSGWRTSRSWRRSGSSTSTATPIGSAARSARIIPHRGGRAVDRRLARRLQQHRLRAWSTSMSAPVKGIIGPWVHKYPHFAVPEPAHRLPAGSACAGGTAG